MTSLEMEEISRLIHKEKILHTSPSAAYRYMLADEDPEFPVLEPAFCEWFFTNHLAEECGPFAVVEEGDEAYDAVGSWLEDPVLPISRREDVLLRWSGEQGYGDLVGIEVDGIRHYALHLGGSPMNTPGAIYIVNMRALP